MILILLLTLSGCLDTQIKIKWFSIPSEYLDCEDFKDFNPTQDAIDEANSGSFRLFSIEMADSARQNNKTHAECYQNSLDAIKYQDKMTENT